jgi:hypothetical protein
MKKFLLLVSLFGFILTSCSKDEVKEDSSVVKNIYSKKANEKTSISGISLMDLPSQLIAGRHYEIKYLYGGIPCDSFIALQQEDTTNGIFLNGVLMNSDWETCITMVEYKNGSFTFQPTKVGNFTFKILSHFENNKPVYKTIIIPVVAI